MGKGKGPVVVSVINLKGGVGKSTITVSLCRFAAVACRLKVLAVDLDPQANLSQAFMRGAYRKFLKNRSPSIVEVFRGYLPPSSSAGSPRPLDAVDAVRQVGSSISLVPSRFDFADNLVESVKPDPRALARFMSDDVFRDTDVVFVDCAPTESIFTQAAYGASRYILVPVRPEYFATIGFPLLKQSLASYRSRNRGHEIGVIGVVINNAFYDGGNDGGPEKRTALEEIKVEANKNGWHVFRHQLPHSRGFPKMMRGDFKHLGNAWTGFRSFAHEFFRRLGI